MNTDKFETFDIFLNTILHSKHNTPSIRFREKESERATTKDHSDFLRIMDSPSCNLKGIVLQ